MGDGFNSRADLERWAAEVPEPFDRIEVSGSAVLDDHGPACPECGSCCADDCKACPTCGHCHDLHGFGGRYCQWQSPAGILCPCLLDQRQVMGAGVERWPDDDANFDNAADLP